jgi:hypothetical protein
MLVHLSINLVKILDIAIKKKTKITCNFKKEGVPFQLMDVINDNPTLMI